MTVHVLILVINASILQLTGTFCVNISTNEPTFEQSLLD